MGIASCWLSQIFSLAAGSPSGQREQLQEELLDLIHPVKALNSP